MRSNQFLTENKGFECWQVLKLCAMLSFNTNVWAHTDTRSSCSWAYKGRGWRWDAALQPMQLPALSWKIAACLFCHLVWCTHITRQNIFRHLFYQPLWCWLSSLEKKKKKERSYFKGYHQQIICATEEQWFDSPNVFILGVLIGEARAERLAHVKIQKDRFIKMWEWRTFLVAKILSSQCSGSRFEPWSGNKIPHATIKDPACCKEDQKSLMPQLWLSTAK